MVKSEFASELVRGPIHVEPKGWGREIWIADNSLYCGEILEISKSKPRSLRFHGLKTESFTCDRAA
jgi:hypothetical protein